MLLLIANRLLLETVSFGFHFDEGVGAGAVKISGGEAFGEHHLVGLAHMIHNRIDELHIIRVVIAFHRVHVVRRVGDLALLRPFELGHAAAARLPDISHGHPPGRMPSQLYVSLIVVLVVFARYRVEGEVRTIIIASKRLVLRICVLVLWILFEIWLLFGALDFNGD